MRTIYCICTDYYQYPNDIVEVFASTWLCIPCVGRFDQETEGYPSSLFVNDLGIEMASLERPLPRGEEE